MNIDNKTFIWFDYFSNRHFIKSYLEIVTDLKEIDKWFKTRYYILFMQFITKHEIEYIRLFHNSSIMPMIKIIKTYKDGIEQEALEQEALEQEALEQEALEQENMKYELKMNNF